VQIQNGRAERIRVMTITTLTIDEIYALEGIFTGLEGLTKRICQDYKVDSSELLKKLETVTDTWEKETYRAPT